LIRLHYLEVLVDEVVDAVGDVVDHHYLIAKVCI
jgi:hypothetical protein